MFSWLSMVSSEVFSSNKNRLVKTSSIHLVQSPTFISIQCHKENHYLHDSDFFTFTVDTSPYLNIFSIAVLPSTGLHICWLLHHILIILNPKRQKLFITSISLLLILSLLMYLLSLAWSSLYLILVPFFSHSASWISLVELPDNFHFWLLG